MAIADKINTLLFTGQELENNGGGTEIFLLRPLGSGEPALLINMAEFIIHFNKDSLYEAPPQFLIV